MRVITFFADADLPPEPRRKQSGFDWHAAICALSASARAALACETAVVTDSRTTMRTPALRVGDAKATGLMLWLLDAQAEAIRLALEPSIMVSPDTLIAGRLDQLFGDWDLCLLTRSRPTPIVNSVIAFRPSSRLAGVWAGIAGAARALPKASQRWGADVDAVVNAFNVQPEEDGIRAVGEVRVRLMPLRGVFRSINAAAPVERMPEPIWDFKGSRKARLPEYAQLL